jgi:PleD family two-component response regulator
MGADDDRLRLSAGIAEIQHGDTAAGLFERADGALYRAKDLGKDRADVGRVAQQQQQQDG